MSSRFSSRETWLGHALALDRSGNERYHKQNQKDKEQDLGDSCGSAGDPSKAEKCGDEGQDKKG